MSNILPSQKQHALLEYIDGFITENDYAPSYREVMRALNYKSVSTVAKHIDGLIERGWLVKRDNSARSVEVVYKKAGQSSAQISPTPSLSSYEDWLRALIDERFKDELRPTTSMESEAIRRSLIWLGFDTLAARYEMSEEVTILPEAASDQQ